MRGAGLTGRLGSTSGLGTAARTSCMAGMTGTGYCIGPGGIWYCCTCLLAPRAALTVAALSMASAGAPIFLSSENPVNHSIFTH